jgi:hypothetical protein
MSKTGFKENFDGTADDSKTREHFVTESVKVRTSFDMFFEVLYLWEGGQGGRGGRGGGVGGAGRVGEVDTLVLNV